MRHATFRRFESLRMARQRMVSDQMFDFTSISWLLRCYPAAFLIVLPRSSVTRSLATAHIHLNSREKRNKDALYPSRELGIQIHHLPFPQLYSSRGQWIGLNGLPLALFIILLVSPSGERSAPVQTLNVLPQLLLRWLNRGRKAEEDKEN